MNEIEPELVSHAISIIGADDISDEEIETRILAFAKDQMLTSRLIDWIPEAFGIVFIPHLAKVNFPTSFSAKSRSGEWIVFDFKVEPIFIIAVRIGMDMFHSGSRSTFKNIVVRGAMLAVVNNALNQGETLDGATLSGPAMIRIPAEIYQPQPLSFWQRLFR